MILETIRSALAWCSVINLLVMLWWFLFFFLAHDWTYRQHCKWFKLSVEHFDTIHYAGIAMFKIFLLFFNLVPYFALRIVL